MQVPALAMVDAELCEQMAELLAELCADEPKPTGQTEAKRSRQALYAAAYVDTFDRGTALRIAGVSPHTFNAWRSEAPFRQLCEYADELVAERVAGEVYRRAVVGVEQGIWHQGRRVGTERKYSDRMLELLAKRIDPAWAEQGRESAPKGNTGAMVARILADESLRDAALALAEAAAIVPTTRTLEAATTATAAPEAQADEG